MITVLYFVKMLSPISHDKIGINSHQSAGGGLSLIVYPFLFQNLRASLLFTFRNFNHPEQIPIFPEMIFRGGSTAGPW